MSDTNKRIETIDLLRGILMALMALDHVKFFFLQSAADIESQWLLLLSKVVTQFCTPLFVFLSGTSVYLSSQNKPKSMISMMLFKRGIWLIFLELVVNNLIWSFNISYQTQIFQIIFAIGICMLALSVLIHLPFKGLLIFALIILFGHNSLDGIVMDGISIPAVIWYILHQNHAVTLTGGKTIIFAFPVLPLIALMCLGYCLGALYTKDFCAVKRSKILCYCGILLTGLFFVIRGINGYGDPVPWSIKTSLLDTVKSFINTYKYPVSLAHALRAIGPALLLLWCLGKFKNRVTDIFVVFGRVPLFYYFLHILVIHLLAVISLYIFAGNSGDITYIHFPWDNPNFKKYGYGLGQVFFIWLTVMSLLYAICLKFMNFKNNNKHIWWLKYI